MGLTSTISRAYNSRRFQRHAESALQRYTNDSTFELTPDTLQEAIENGSLLGAYDLLRPDNITRYHPQSPQLLGAHIPAADPLENVEHKRVSRLDILDAETPRTHLVSALYDYVLGGFGRVIGTDAEMRDVAKGLVDLYKHAQYTQARHSRRLTEQEAAVIIDQYQTTATRRTLEQLTCDLEYVAQVATGPTPLPAYPYGVTPRTTVTKITPDALEEHSQIKGLAAMPDAYKGLIQEGFVITAATASPLGFLAGYGLFKGAGILSRFVGDAISHSIREAGRTYSQAEDGYKNGAELFGTLAGLGTFGVAMAATGGGAAFGIGTAFLAGGAGFTYAGKRNRQKARDTRRALEEALQTGTDPSTDQTQIDSLLDNAKRYEKYSTACKIASLLGLGYGLASDITLPSLGGSTPDTEAPTITRTEFNEGSTTHTFNRNTTPTLSFEVDAKDNSGIDTITAYIHKVGSTQAPQVLQIYPDNVQDQIQHALGMNTIKDGGELTLTNLSPGDYIVNATATDFGGNSSLVEQVGKFTVIDTPVTPGPTPTPGPSPTPTPGPNPIPGTTDYVDWDIRRMYDDHGHLTKPINYADIKSSYIGAAEHENAIIFDKATKSGIVDLTTANNDCSVKHAGTDPHGIHTDGQHNFKVFFEGYQHKDFDGNGTLETKLTTARLIDIDTSGKYILPNDIDLSTFSGYQVWFADVHHEGNNTLCVESIASVNVDVDEKGPLGYIVEKEEACHGKADVPSPTHTNAPKDNCGPCAKPCDKDYYVPVGVIDSKTVPCTDGAPVLTHSTLVPAGTLDSVVNTFSYAAVDITDPVSVIPGTLDTAPHSGNLDAPTNPFGYTPQDVTVPVPRETFETAPTGGNLDAPIDPFAVDPLSYNLWEHYQPIYFIDEAILREFERNQAFALELRHMA